MNLTDIYNDTFEGIEEQELDLEKIAEAEAIEAEEMEKIAADYVTAGRFMARGYADEMEKLATASDLAKLQKVVKGSKLDKLKDAGKWLISPGKRYKTVAQEGRLLNRLPVPSGKVDTKGAFGSLLKTPEQLEKAQKTAKEMRKAGLKGKAKSVARIAGNALPEAAAIAGAGYGAKKLYDRRK